MIELYCDESRQDLFYNKKVISDTNKYIFIGGIKIETEDRTNIKNKINNLKNKYNINLKTELKWNRVSKKYLSLYKEMIDIFISMNINFRAICIDSSKIDLNYHNNNPELGFYKFYYQLLNNWVIGGNKYIIYTDIKTNSDPNVLNNLKRCLNNKTHSNCIDNIYAIESKESVFLQLEDIIMGATSYKMNFGNEGMSHSKSELVFYLEKQLGHKLIPTSRNAKKFNLFEIRL